MSDSTNPLDIIKRLDVKQNVTIRVIDEATDKVVQEHVGHNAATNSMLTGIAHYLLGDGTLNQGSDMLTSWVPQYISLGTMGLTSQDSEELRDDEDPEQYLYYVPAGIGTTLPAPANSTAEEKELNATLRFTEYLNQCPGFGADGYDENTNNDRPYFGLGLPYDYMPAPKKQDFFSGDGANRQFTLSSVPTSIVSITVYKDGVVNQDEHDLSVKREVIPSDYYTFTNNTVSIFDGWPAPAADSRLAIIYTIDSKEASTCELIDSTSLRSKITYRGLIPEVQSEVPGTLDIIYSAFISTGELAKYRGDRDYIYITEAGLWSKPSYTTGGDNGLLAGYRIMPSDDEVPLVEVHDSFTYTGPDPEYLIVQFKLTRKNPTQIDTVVLNGEVLDATTYSLEPRVDEQTGETDYWIVFSEPPAEAGTIVVVYRVGDSEGTWKDMSHEDNRRLVQKSILRIGKGQVAQIVWKLQLGGLEQLEGLRYLYPEQYPDDVWIIWND